jgi:hypothetical protein
MGSCFPSVPVSEGWRHKKSKELEINFPIAKSSNKTESQMGVTTHFVIPDVAAVGRGRTFGCMSDKLGTAICSGLLPVHECSKYAYGIYVKLSVSDIK